MIFVFYFFAAVLVYLSYKSFRGGIDYLNFFKQELAKPESGFTPFASVIVPCRGLDEELEENLSALFRQNYPNYEVIFVVDSETDEAVSVIDRLINRKDTKSQKKSVPLAVAGGFIRPAKIVVAGKSENESQKVHNLREAVGHVAEESKIFVFVDSDARPAENWLKNLAAPLEDEKIGVSSAYRWFISKKMNFGSEMRSVWNASIASALGANTKSNFCWGGSMAVRRETFEKLEIREKWRGTLSDDFAVTRAMKKAGLEIFFVPQALTASVENCSLKECLEFTTRQMKITRVYSPNLWIASFIGSGLFNLVFICGISVLIFNRVDEFSFWFALAALVLVAIFSVGKSWLRLNAVRLVLKDYDSNLRQQFWTQNTLWIFTPAVFFYNAFAALISRKIIWRGIKYKLISPDETEILAKVKRQK